MKIFLSFLLSGFILFIGFLIGRFYPSSSSFTLDLLDNPQSVLYHINLYRKSQGQSDMIFNESLCKLASERLEEIPLDWSHNGFHSRASSSSFFQQYCPFCQGVGENLAKSFLSESSLASGWINSPGHLRNIVDPFKNACIVVNNGYAVLISSY